MATLMVKISPKHMSNSWSAVGVQISWIPESDPEKRRHMVSYAMSLTMKSIVVILVNIIAYCMLGHWCGQAYSML